MPYAYEMLNGLGNKGIFFQGSFNRVNVILGSNGSGKSTVLQMLRDSPSAAFGQDLIPIYVEGGRALNIDTGMGLDIQTIDLYHNFDQARRQYDTSKRQSINQRLQRTFKLLYVLDRAERIEHSDNVDKWYRAGRNGEPPARKPPLIERLDAHFNAVFPNLNLFVNQHTQLSIRKGQVEYSASLASDGEKQILVMLADLVLLNDNKSLFLVDEPELNLHPNLANDFWTFVESLFSDSIFVYATHSISFAMRSSVESIHVLGFGNIEPKNLDLSADHLQPFLGSLSRMNDNRFCLFVEGDEASFDKPFYEWITGRKDISVIPVGSSNEVLLATSRQGLWKKLSPSLFVAGIVDRDFKSNQNIDLIGKNVLVLDLHEAESYLCNPKLISDLNERLSSTVRSFTESEALIEIISIASERINYVSAQRVFAKTYVNLSLSVERRGMSSSADLEELKKKLVEAAANEAAKAADTFAVDHVVSSLDHELEQCLHSISARDSISILRIFEGKRFLQRLGVRAGCASPLAVMRAVAKHIDPSDYEHTAKLSAAIEEIFKIRVDPIISPA